MKHSIRLIATACGPLIAGLGCLPSLQMNLETAAVRQPVSGAEVVIVEVVDDRRFSTARSEHGTPSLDPERVGEPGYQSRAIGRHNNGSEVLLPEGRTLEAVVREVVAAAFRKEGFRVVNADAAARRFIPVQVVVERFWGWTEGSWTIHYNFDAGLRLSVAREGQDIDLRANENLRLGSSGAQVNRRWQSTLDRGLAELTENLRTEIRLKLGGSSLSSSPNSWRR